MNLFIATAHAAELSPYARNLLNQISRYIIDPIIILIFGVAMVVFLYGIFKFIRSADNPTERDEGKRNMFWGLIGMTIMVSAFGIINLIAGTVGNNDAKQEVRNYYSG
jgi:tellurite resistance protein TehA-like permease